MKHATAIDQLEIHAFNSENKAAVQEREGEHESAANNPTNAADCGEVIEALKANS